MRYKRLLSLVLSLMFVFSMCAGTMQASAASSADISKLQQQNAEAQKKIDALKNDEAKAKEYVQALDKKIQIIKDQINMLQSQANSLQASINSIESKIAEAEAEMQRIQDEINAKQEEFDKVFNEYCQRLRAMYVSGNASNLEVLLTSKDISSILTRSEMIKSIARKDSGILNDLIKKMEEIEKDKAALEKTRLELQEDKKKLQDQKAELDANIAEVAKSKAELDAQIAEANAAMRRIQSTQAEYMESISANNDEIQKIRDEIRRQQAAVNTGSTSGSTGSGAFSGSMRYPTDSTRISAGFPNYSGGGYHGGVDFPVPTGSNVYAAASGTVIIAKQLNYSYGYYIVIDHGSGVSTLYAHNSALLVGVGTNVNKGQVIARSGSTGNSTGPHCHFEVLINGSQVNPMGYL